MTANQLKRWRAALDITQEQAAELLGLSLSGFRKYEQGVSPIPEPVALLALLLTAKAKEKS